MDNIGSSDHDPSIRIECASGDGGYLEYTYFDESGEATIIVNDLGRSNGFIIKRDSLSKLFWAIARDIQGTKPIEPPKPTLDTVMTDLEISAATQEAEAAIWNAEAAKGIKALQEYERKAGIADANLVKIATVLAKEHQLTSMGRFFQAVADRYTLDLD